MEGKGKTASSLDVSTIASVLAFVLLLALVMVVVVLGLELTALESTDNSAEEIEVAF